MARLSGSYLARGQTDAGDQLVAAEEPLAGLQLRCGGDLPGLVAIPELLELVRKSRAYNLKLGRKIRAFDGSDLISAWVDVLPGHKDGCIIGVSNWQTSPASPEAEAKAASRALEIDRTIAELHARLDPKQNVLTVESIAPDLGDLAAAMERGTGRPWTGFIDLPGSSHAQPLHWRLLDGARCTIPGSGREWRAVLVPLGDPEPGSAGFDLYLVADTPPPKANPSQMKRGAEKPAPVAPLMGRDITPVLRRPIARIIANAETIRTKLAGPLADEYSSYAADIASAGQHLLALIDDLADLEVVEAEGFTTAPDDIDLADVARRATGILSMRAKERNVTLVIPQEGETLHATGEFRRVLQILLNLLGNAINYSPEGSQIWVRLDEGETRARITIADQGPGLSAAQQEKVFEKFERLGRSGDGGSGLGLYISRQLARAMKGELSVESAPGKGARFTLDLPARKP